MPTSRKKQRKKYSRCCAAKKIFTPSEEKKIIKEALHIDNAESYDEIYEKSDLASLIYKYSQKKRKGIPKMWKNGKPPIEFFISVLERNPDETLASFRKKNDKKDWLEVRKELRENQIKFRYYEKFDILNSVKNDPTAKSIEDIYRNSNLGEKVYEMCEEKRKKYREIWGDNKKASLKWCSRFLKDLLKDNYLKDEFKSKFPNFIYEVEEPRELDTKQQSISLIKPSETPQIEQDIINPTVPESQKESSNKKFKFTDTKALLESLKQNDDVQSFEDICEKTKVGEIALNLIGTKQKPKSWKGKLPVNVQIDILKQCSTEYPKIFESKFPNFIQSLDTDFLDRLMSEEFDKLNKSSVESQIDTEELHTSSIKEVDEPQPEIQYIKETENLENKATRFSETPFPESQLEREKEKGIVPSLKSQVTDDSRSAIDEFYEHEQNPIFLDSSIEEVEEENKELEKELKLTKKIKYDLYDLNEN